MVALGDCMPMTSWLVLTMYFCFFCLTCRYVVEGPGGKIFSVISLYRRTVIVMEYGSRHCGRHHLLLGVLNMASHGPYFGRKLLRGMLRHFFLQIWNMIGGSCFSPVYCWQFRLYFFAASCLTRNHYADGRVCFPFRVLYA